MSRPFPRWIGSVIVAAGLAALAQPAAAEPMPVLPIVLQVPGRSIPLHLVIRAKGEVARIYRDAGISVTWIDPTSDTARLGHQPAGGASAPGLGLVVLSRKFTDQLSVSPDALGGATGSREGRGRIAYVFYDRVEQIADAYLNTAQQHRNDMATVIVLAHAMAHEIGHLLLPYGHSETGLMRADWDEDDLRDALDQRLNFTAEQAEVIRGKLRAPLAAE